MHGHELPSRDLSDFECLRPIFFRSNWLYHQRGVDERAGRCLRLAVYSPRWGHAGLFAKNSLTQPSGVINLIADVSIALW